MFENLHIFWQGLASWFEADGVLPFLCLCVGLMGILLWIWLKKWDCLRMDMAVPTAALSEGGGLARSRAIIGVDASVPGKSLVLEWEVRKSLHGLGDIGDLERRLVMLQELRLDVPYRVVVGLYAKEGGLSPKIVEILGRRFPGYAFHVLRGEGMLL